MESRSGKDPDAGKDWGQEERGATEDKMVGWHHQLNGHEFEQTLGDSEGQGSLVCCSSGLQRVESLNNSNGLLSSMVSVNNSPLCSHGLFPLLCNQLPFSENSSTPSPYWSPLPQAEQHPPTNPCRSQDPAAAESVSSLSCISSWFALNLHQWNNLQSTDCSTLSPHPTLGLLIFFKEDKVCTHLY